MPAVNGNMVAPIGGGGGAWGAALAAAAAAAPQGKGSSASASRAFGSGEAGATLGYIILWEIGVDIGSERADYPGSAYIKENKRRREQEQREWRAAVATSSMWLRYHRISTLLGPKL